MNPNIFQPLPVPGSEEIREILVKRVDRQKQAVGIVVGVIEPAGRRVVAYGHLAKGDSRTLDGDTIFEIGSVTKIFTSLLLADMVSRKEVTLDDPASKYLPANVKMPQNSGKSITLLDLSTHHSGSGYEYSNEGVGLLGQILAYRAGTDYESLIGTRITRPLSMPDTGITLSSFMEKRMATGHNAMLAPVGRSELPAPLAGAGALRSSPNDMLTFLAAFLGYKESSLAPAMKAMLAVRRSAGQATIGLGWLIYSTGGREMAGHSGRTGGFCSTIGYNPVERIGVVVLSNASTPSGVDDIGLHLLNPQMPPANPEAPNQRIEISIDPKLLDHYTGRYQVTPNLIFEITRDGDRLFAQGFAQAAALPKFELFADGEKKFFARVADHQIEFETGPEGQAVRLILHRAGRDLPAARLP